MKVRLPLFLYAAIVLTASLGLIFFIATFIIPKQAYLKADLHETAAVIQGTFTFAYSLAPSLNGLFWPISVATLFLILAGSLPMLPVAVVGTSRALVVASSIPAFIFALWLVVGTEATGTVIQGSMMIRTTSYERTLARFALKESAEGRFLQFQDQIAKMSAGEMPKPIRSEMDISATERTMRIRTMVSLLKENDKPATQKTLLASSWIFRETVLKNDDLSAKLLPFARSQAGVDFPDMQAFYQWLKPQLGQGDWKPVTLYQF